MLLVVKCCLAFDVDVCCLLFVVCCFGMCWLLIVVRCALFVVCCLLLSACVFVVCGCVLFDV